VLLSAVMLCNFARLCVDQRPAELNEQTMSAVIVFKRMNASCSKLSRHFGTCGSAPPDRAGAITITRAFPMRAEGAASLKSLKFAACDYA
jgi:hypothetical protein